ncbi:MAG: transketolase [Odoribacter sp.]
MNTSNRAADNIRILAAAMVEKAKSGHPGGAMGGADYVNVLYSEFLNFDPEDAQWVNRDRFFLDPGHMSPMLYATLSLIGKYSMEDLKNFRQWGSITPGHPEVDVKRGVENTSGPLGQGHTMAVGAAIAERFLVARFGEWMSHKTYAFISDGGIQEEISQGAGRIAGTLGLSNLIMFYDSNNIQLSTKVEEVTHEDTAKKYEAWGWQVISINGNNADEIRKALKKAQAETQRPTIIIGHTLMGKGAMGANEEDYSNKVSTHGQPLSAAGASFEKTVANLGGDPQHPFTIFPDVAAFYDKALDEKRAIAKKKKAEQAVWEKANPELATKFHRFMSGEAPAIDYKAIEHKANIASRAASADVLVTLAQEVENMIVSSADLSNSDKTDGYIKGGARNIVKGDFSGKFLQAGVSELTMAAICNGIALHGGIHVACGTFFVFSDYMKPAFRLSALMEVPVKYIWTHDAFRVGEDGPTHQPIEHEAQLRLMEKMQNHSGQMSLLALRPADAAETSVAWKMAMENTTTPTALVLSRQNINDLPSTGKRYDDALKAMKGAYIVSKNSANPDVILIASGSEVATLVEASQLLKERKDITTQIVSAISEGLFRTQPTAYQEEVIPSIKPKFGLTAGLSVTLEGLVGSNGKIHGVNHFGYSAPAKVLDEKFGFTGEFVYNEICEMLKK